MEAIYQNNGHSIVVSSDRLFDRTKLAGLDAPSDVSSLGSGLEIVYRQSRNLDWALAEKHLELRCLKDIERPLRDNHVAFLVQQMRGGTFRPELVNLITCEFDGADYRMNGQHTAWARLEMPNDWPCQVTVMKYKAHTEPDLRRLYSSIDRAAPRTPGHVVISYLYGTTEFEGVSASNLKLIAQGLGFYLTGKSSRKSPDELAYMMITDRLSQSILVNELLGTVRGSGGEFQHLHRQPVVAAMFATLEKAPAVASKQFWPVVRDGVGIDSANDPRHRLRNLLMTLAVNHGRGAGSDKDKQTAEDMYRSCIQAWNAWRQGGSLKVLRKSFSGDRQKVHK